MLGRVLFLIVLSVLITSSPNPLRAARTELLVSVAASMTDVALEIKPLFEAAHPGATVLFNFGSSGALQQQIARGAPVDVFISAAEEPVARLMARGHVVPESLRRVASNRLVLVGPAGERAEAPLKWMDLTDDAIKRVAIGNPQHVPAGVYARETLQSLKVWESLASKLVLAEDVRQVLHYVQIGAVDVGIVYATDAASSSAVEVIATAPDGTHSPIIYPLVKVGASRHSREADAFVDFLFTQEAQEVLARNGFAAPK